MLHHLQQCDRIYIICFLKILLRDSKGVTDQQMKEYRISFNHFDKGRTRRLEAKEFKACLVSLGYNIRDDPQVKIMSLTKIDYKRAKPKPKSFCK